MKTFRPLGAGLAALAGVALCASTHLASGPPGPSTVWVETFASAASFRAEWTVKKWRGAVDLLFETSQGAPALDLVSRSSSWAFLRRVDVDLTRTPVLAWSWRVDAYPPSGDGRRAESDDEPAQVYVFFPGKGPAGRLQPRILGYTWETVPEAGTFYHSPKNDGTRVFVLRSRRDGQGIWASEARDVAGDFERAFGESAPRPLAVCFQIDSDDTASTARSAFAALRFTSR